MGSVQARARGRADGWLPAVDREVGECHPVRVEFLFGGGGWDLRELEVVDGESI